jgi:hypothetical protein
MALNQDSTVSLESRTITLSDIREFVETTETWGADTLVKVDSTAGGQVKIEAKFGDILR